MCIVPTILLKRCVSCRSLALNDGDSSRFVTGHQFYETEVNEFNETRRHQFNIGGLDITVEDRGRLLMHIRERTTKLIRPIENLALFKKPVICARLFNDLPKIMARHIVHHKVFTPSLREIIRHFREIRVIESGKDRGLLPELLLKLVKKVRLQIRVWSDFLDRTDTSREQGILGSINCAHSTLTNGARDHISLFQKSLRFK